MHFPVALLPRFAPVRALRLSPERERMVWLTTGVDGVRRVLKFSRTPGNVPDLLDTLATRLAANPSAHLVVPLDHGRVEHWYYEVTPYFADGALGEQAPRGVPSRDPVWLRSVFSQLLSALGVLHRCDQQDRCIVHGDIKPSNVLIDRYRTGWVFALSDFETAIHLQPGQRAAPCGRCSTAYAAPEVLAGAIGVAADYWSLGMVMLELIAGRPVFEGRDEGQIRRLLATVWQPDLQGIEQSEWRALLAGLLERNPATRWQQREGLRWLEGDPAIISAGLTLAGESAAAQPLTVAGTRVFSARGLGQALLRCWDVASLHSPETATWLDEHVHRTDARLLLQALLDDAALSDEQRLLNLAFALAPGSPAVWRGLELSAPTLAAQAREAAGGDAASAAWLLSLLDGICFEFYADHGVSAVGALGESVLSVHRDHVEAWDAIIAAGAPADARPGPELSASTVVALACSAPVVEDLRAQASRLLDPGTLLLREPWFLTFGSDIDALSPARLSILMQLDEASLLAAVNVRALDELGAVDPARLRNAVIVLDSQRGLLRGSTVQAGEAVHVLAPGQRHGGLPRSALDRLWQRIGDACAESWHRWWARRFPSRSEPQWASVRVVRLAMGERFSGVPLQTEAYLALLAWQVEDACRVRVLVADAAATLFSVRLKTPRMASEGRMLLVIVSTSTLHFVRHRRWWQLPERTRGIQICCDRVPLLAPIDDDLDPADAEIDGPDALDGGALQLHDGLPRLQCPTLRLAQASVVLAPTAPLAAVRRPRRWPRGRPAMPDAPRAPRRGALPAQRNSAEGRS